MRKNVMFLVLVAVAVTPVFGELSFGVKGAVSDYSYYGDDWDNIKELFDALGVEVDNEFSFSFSVGGFVELMVLEQVGIQPEILYTRASVQYGDGDDWVRTTWNMIEIPVYLKGVFPLDSGSAYLMGGPDFFYLLGDGSVTTSDDSFTGDATADNDLLIGMAIAGGYEFENGVFVGAKFSGEFTGASDDAELYISGLGIEAGYKFK